MVDLEYYSDDELALRVFNDPYFYNEIGNLRFLVALCYEEFFFTDKQLQVLLDAVEEANEFDGVTSDGA